MSSVEAVGRDSGFSGYCSKQGICYRLCGLSFRCALGVCLQPLWRSVSDQFMYTEQVRLQRRGYSSVATITPPQQEAQEGNTDTSCMHLTRIRRCQWSLRFVW